MGDAVWKENKHRPSSEVYELSSFVGEKLEAKGTQQNQKNCMENYARHTAGIALSLQIDTSKSVDSVLYVQVVPKI
jgi:hypothetical protein